MLKSIIQDIVHEESLRLPVEPAATVLRNAKEVVLKHEEYSAKFELVRYSKIGLLLDIFN